MTPGDPFRGAIPVAFFSQALEAERAAAAETAEVQPLQPVVNHQKSSF